MDVLPNYLDRCLKGIEFRVRRKKYLQPQALTDPHFLW
jgi:hypothetical protein